jgi:hypothetical protein
LGEGDGTEAVEHAQRILDRLSRERHERDLAAAADAEVDALDADTVRPRAVQDRGEEDLERKRRAAQAARAKAKR